MCALFLKVFVGEPLKCNASSCGEANWIAVEKEKHNVLMIQNWEDFELFKIQPKSLSDMQMKVLRMQTHVWLALFKIPKFQSNF